MFDFKITEHEVLEHWKINKTFERSLQNRQKSKRFVFFEGPPTANGLPGIHHVLARAFKDVVCRYKTMRGFYVLRKAGWDTHGLPVELEIEKQLGFKNKKDIEVYGIAEFNKKAKESVWKYKKEWEDMTRKMGFWLDLSNPYITYENHYIESLWAIIKKIWDKKLLYKAHRVVPFCTRCGTPLSFHEVAQGYKTVTDLSVTVKFKLKSSQKIGNTVVGDQTYVLAWTTTSWTLPGNVALAVGKNIKYQVVSIKGSNENYILAADLVNKVLADTKHEILDTKYGKDLVGLEYDPLFDIKELKSDLPTGQAGKSYKIYDADFVSTGDGTGVVHTAVMYGEDDYNLGTKIGLPKFHTVDEAGKFIHVSGELNGMYVKSKEAEDLIIKKLGTENRLLKTEPHEHDYPFCWRCGTALLYYAKTSWFIKMSAVNKKLLANALKINWIPGHIKEGRFGQWLKEGKDWTFSRERYWGTPLSIWQCTNCGEHKVVGSLEDLEKNRLTPKNSYYFLRHSFNTHSVTDDSDLIISTRIENDKYNLTENGKKQAKEVAQKLKKIGVDAIYASPFWRTKQTAQIIADELGVKFHTDERLKELDHGSMCEGRTEYVCIPPDFQKDLDTKYGDGESWRAGRIRMFDFIKETDLKHENKKILIISHRSPLWLLESSLLGMNDEESINKRNELYLKEGELRRVDFKNYPYDSQGSLDMHRPFIDQIHLKCKKCGSKMKKVPDLIDVWFDSGAMPFAQWHWPFENKKIFESQFPADYIVEAIDQTRGWFYTLLAVSTLLDKGAPYKNVISLSHILDEKGQKMSKSKGNVVSLFEVMDKFGADATRWYCYTINSPGDYKLFTTRDVEAKLKGFLFTLSNCLRFYELYKLTKNSQPTTHNNSNLLDGWILSKLNRLILGVTDNLEKYDVTSAARAIESFIVEDFSNWWLRRSRKRKESIGMLRFILFEIAKLLAPFAPFMAEEIYMKVDHIAGETNSVHLQDWPKVNQKAINDELETEMGEVKNIVTQGLAIRKEKQIKVRQPLALLTINRGEKFDPGLEDLIKEELNVKEINYDSTQGPSSYKENQKELLVYDLELTQALVDEGLAREIVRQIQDIRKEAGYKFDQEIYCQWHSDSEDLKRVIKNWGGEIKKDTILRELEEKQHDNEVYDIEKEMELAPNKKIWLGVKKL